MRHVTILFLISCLFIAIAKAGPIPTETGDYCKDQILDFMRTQFHEDIELTNWDKMKMGRSGDYLYWFDAKELCEEGSFYVEVPVSSGSCSTVHYWYVPLYVHRIRGDKDCKRYYPRYRPIRKRDMRGCYSPSCD